MTTLPGLRDRAILAVLIGCGLRREELVRLTLEHVQPRDGAWAIIDLRGKRNKVGSVPLAGWVKVALDEWVEAAGITCGLYFHPINKGGVMSPKPLSAQAIWKLVARYRHVVAEGGKRALIAPHDLRRTFAKLAHQGQVPLEQIQLALRHAHLATTIKYINPEQDFADPPGERFGLVIRRSTRSAVARSGSPTGSIE